MELAGLAVLGSGIGFFGVGVPFALGVLSIWARRPALARMSYGSAWLVALAVVTWTCAVFDADFLSSPRGDFDPRFAVGFLFLCVAPLVRGVAWGPRTTLAKIGICSLLLGGPPGCLAAHDCFLRVDRHQAAPTDPRDAVVYYRRRCRFGDRETRAASFAQLGYHYELGRGVRPDLPHAVALYRLSCGDSNAAGCYYLAHAYEDGIVVGRDAVRAATLYRNACSSGRLAEACFQLGELHSRGEGTNRDDQRALELFKQACDLHDERGCVRLGLSHLNGVGVEKDDVAAVRLFRSACRGDSWHGNSQPDACYYLGQMYANGRGLTAHPGEARSFFTAACEGGIEEACRSTDDNSTPVPR